MYTRDSPFDVTHCRPDRIKRRASLTREVECDAAALANADRGVVTAGLAQRVNELLPPGLIAIRIEAIGEQSRRIEIERR